VWDSLAFQPSSDPGGAAVGDLGGESVDPEEAEWNGAVADLLEPFVRVMHREQVRQSPWIQCDDTTLEVQDQSRAPEIRTGHLWVYRGELGEVVYDFTWSRNRDGPLKMLAGYRGYLQVDAAPAYDDVFTQYPGIIEAAVKQGRGISKAVDRELTLKVPNPGHRLAAAGSSASWLSTIS
jgi:hypothetical protein